MRGDVALSFLLVSVSFDFPAIFQLPSTSLFRIEIETISSKLVDKPCAGVEEVILMLVPGIEVVVRRELSSSGRFCRPPVQVSYKVLLGDCYCLGMN